METTTPVAAVSTSDVVMEDTSSLAPKTNSDLVFGTVADLEIGIVASLKNSDATSLAPSDVLVASENPIASDPPTTVLSPPNPNPEINFTVLPQKNTAPIFTNKASGSYYGLANCP
ncbi:hypothetical protein Bca52824_024554 [Brassica carinata]|uniref:Uncharacterized protein n=1 Tax=Brassica carinata TaxID=52824 RepID=A0A8X8AVS8_BRACI|nr:hypothetical protein Bca52824_024554 [Brassica carinata]